MLQCLFSSNRYHDEVNGRSQPDGLQNEKCSIISLFSIHNMNDWHDVACAYDKILNFICEIDKTAKNRGKMVM